MKLNFVLNLSFLFRFLVTSTHDYLTALYFSNRTLFWCWLQHGLWPFVAHLISESADFTLSFTTAFISKIPLHININLNFLEWKPESMLKVFALTSVLNEMENNSPLCWCFFFFIYCFFPLFCLLSPSGVSGLCFSSAPPLKHNVCVILGVSRNGAFGEAGCGNSTWYDLYFREWYRDNGNSRR